MKASPLEGPASTEQRLRNYDADAALVLRCSAIDSDVLAGTGKAGTSLLEVAPTSVPAPRESPWVSCKDRPSAMQQIAEAPVSSSFIILQHEQLFVPMARSRA
jgi:hypothetical protein